MKNLVKVLVLTFGMLFSVNAQNLKDNTRFKDVKIENVSIRVEVDSAEELESTFTVKDFEELLDQTEAGEELSFKIKCNGKKMSNGVKSSMSFSIKGNTDNKKDFLKNLAKLRNAAMNYYKSKK